MRLIRHYAPLLLGATLALIMHTTAGHRMLVKVATPSTALLATASAIVLSVAGDVRDGGIAFQLMVTLILANVVLYPATAGARVLAVRPAVFVATLSYPLYLFHSFGLKAADLIVDGSSTISSVLALGICLAVSVPVCWMLNRWVELPMQNVGRRFAHTVERRFSGAIKEPVAVSGPLVAA